MLSCLHIQVRVSAHRLGSCGISCHELLQHSRRLLRPPRCPPFRCHGTACHETEQTRHDAARRVRIFAAGEAHALGPTNRQPSALRPRDCIRVVKEAKGCIRVDGREETLPWPAHAKPFAALVIARKGSKVPFAQLAGRANEHVVVVDLIGRRTGHNTSGHVRRVLRKPTEPSERLQMYQIRSQLYVPIECLCIPNAPPLYRLIGAANAVKLPKPIDRIVVPIAVATNSTLRSANVFCHVRQQ